MSQVVEATKKYWPYALAVGAGFWIIIRYGGDDAAPATGYGIPNAYNPDAIRAGMESRRLEAEIAAASRAAEIGLEKAKIEATTQTTLAELQAQVSREQIAGDTNTALAVAQSQTQIALAQTDAEKWVTDLTTARVLESDRIKTGSTERVALATAQSAARIEQSRIAGTERMAGVAAENARIIAEQQALTTRQLAQMDLRRDQATTQNTREIAQIAAATARLQIAAGERIATIDANKDLRIAEISARVAQSQLASAERAARYAVEANRDITLATAELNAVFGSGGGFASLAGIVQAGAAESAAGYLASSQVSATAITAASNTAMAGLVASGQSTAAYYDAIGAANTAVGNIAANAWTGRGMSDFASANALGSILGFAAAAI